jgi:hypothetical protein
VKPLFAAVVLALALAPIAAAGIEPGTYFIRDGPRAGLDVHVNEDGRASGSED